MHIEVCILIVEVTISFQGVLSEWLKPTKNVCLLYKIYSEVYVRRWFTQ